METEYLAVLVGADGQIRVLFPVAEATYVELSDPNTPGDSTASARLLYSEGAGVCRHEVGDANCVAGWCGASRYPILCKCGGLIHADWGDEDYDGNYWVYLACDRCEDAYEEADSQ